MHRRFTSATNTTRVAGLRYAGSLVMLALAAACAPARPVMNSPAPVTADPRVQLRAMLDSIVRAPEFRSARWGVLVVDPASGDTLYSHDAGKLFMPASNQKLITGAVALALLGPDYRYATTVAATGPVRDGIIEGDLAVLGAGDPTVSDAMRGDATVPLRQMAESLHVRGIRVVRGRVVSARDAFPDSVLGFGWSWDDLDYYYSAGVDELLLNEGVSEVIVRGGANPGDPPTVVTRPAQSSPRVQVNAVTIARPAGDTTWRHSLSLAGVPMPGDSASNAVLTGAVAVGDSVTFNLAHRNPSAAYLVALTEALRNRGIEVEGRFYGGTDAFDSLFTTWSPPMRDILPRMQKPSQNQVAEVLYKTLGLEQTGVGTADSARRVVERQLVEWGAQRDGFAVRDGSGLSRHDYLTPETVIRVLDAMRRHPQFTLFYESLPVAGVEGTIRLRMRGTPAQGNVRAKTGTLDKARSLSGYVTTAGGRMLMFSFLVNNWTTPVREVDRAIDAAVVWMAVMP